MSVVFLGKDVKSGWMAKLMQMTKHNNGVARLRTVHHHDCRGATEASNLCETISFIKYL